MPGNQPPAELQTLDDLVRIVAPIRIGRAQPRMESNHARPFTSDDPLWKIVGLIDDPNGPTDVSSNKHKYLAEVYAPDKE